MIRQSASRTVTLPPPKVVARRGDVVTASAPTISISAFDKLREALSVLATSPRDVLGVVKDFIDLVTGLPHVAAAAYFLRGSNDSQSLGPNTWSDFAFDREPFHNGVRFACTQAARTKQRRRRPTSGYEASPRWSLQF